MNARICAILIVVGLLFPIHSISWAQSAQRPVEENILVPKSSLPPEVLREVEEQQALADMKKKVETYGEWVGVGKEVGVAINDSLVAITDQADNFSKTGVGKFTMVIVAYKVLGNDVVGILIGVPMLVAWAMFVIWYVRKNTMTISVLKRVNSDKSRDYEIIHRQNSDRALAERSICMVVAIIVGLIIIAGVIF